MCLYLLSFQLCTLRREILTSAESYVRKPLMLAERTEKTTDKLLSEFFYFTGDTFLVEQR